MLLLLLLIEFYSLFSTALQSSITKHILGSAKEKRGHSRVLAYVNLYCACVILTGRTGVKNHCFFGYKYFDNEIIMPPASSCCA